MSVFVVTDVWKDSPSEGTARLVMLALADWANDDGEAWPSLPQLAKKCRVSERQVHRLVLQLEKSGELIIEHQRGRNKSNRYLVRPGRKLDIQGQNDQENQTSTVNKTRHPGTLKLDTHVTQYVNRTVNRTVTPPTPPVGGDPPKPKSIKTPIPDNLQDMISMDVMNAMSQEQGLSHDQLRSETVAMLDHFRGNGERKVDWVATWRNWMRSPYRKSKQNGHAPPGPAKITPLEEDTIRMANGMQPMWPRSMGGLKDD